MDSSDSVDFARLSV